ncbi:hypothetical protein N7535_009433 [Penicillium sp. DV-2018c]|nr:hypothetical protein N7535_009433 [Penicillium sp. DV-2018c]
MDPRNSSTHEGTVAKGYDSPHLMASTEPMGNATVTIEQEHEEVIETIDSLDSSGQATAASASIMPENSHEDALAQRIDSVQPKASDIDSKQDLQPKSHSECEVST